MLSVWGQELVLTWKDLFLLNFCLVSETHASNDNFFCSYWFYICSNFLSIVTSQSLLWICIFMNYQLMSLHSKHSVNIWHETGTYLTLIPSMNRPAEHTATLVSSAWKHVNILPAHVKQHTANVNVISFAANKKVYILTRDHSMCYMCQTLHPC